MVIKKITPVNATITITLCGSMACADKMCETEQALTSRGYQVLAPSPEEENDYSSLPRDEKATTKHEWMVRHFKKIRTADAILVVNEEKKGTPSYIGANTFLEMGFAFVLGKKIFLLNDVPHQSNEEEILGLLPIELHGDVSRIG